MNYRWAEMLSRWPTLAAATLAALIAVPTPARAATGTLAVIAHKKVPVSSISSAQLRELFLKRKRRWPGGAEVVPLINADKGGALYRLFTRKVLRISARELAAHWVKQAVRGRGSALPSAIGSSVIVRRMVASTAGAISFLEATAVDGTVKVLKIGGKAPGDAGYLLGAATAERRTKARVSHKDQARLLLVAMAYDRNLRKRAGDKLTVGVLYRAGQPGAIAESRSMRSELRKMGEAKIAGLPFGVLRLPFEGQSSLLKDIRLEGIDALYVCDAKLIPAAARVATKAKILGLGCDEQHVHGGIAIGVGQRDGRPALMVNLKAVRSAGADLPARLLRIATVVGR